MGLLILMRHGQSMWNAANLFTGWVDVPLTQKGIDEAIEAGKSIAEIPISEVHTSALIRAQMTAMIALAQHSSNATPVYHYPETENGDSNQRKMADWSQIRGDVKNIIPVHVSWRLNERMYGNLQGLNRDECRERWGDEQVHIWRRSYDIPPPQGESLKLTSQRTIPYVDSSIIPSLESGNNLLLVAHGNSVRSIIMHLDGMNEEEVVSLEVPTGVPIIYEYSDGVFIRR